MLGGCAGGAGAVEDAGDNRSMYHVIESQDSGTSKNEQKNLMSVAKKK